MEGLLCIHDCRNLQRNQQVVVQRKLCFFLFLKCSNGIPKNQQLRKSSMIRKNLDFLPGWPYRQLPIHKKLESMPTSFTAWRSWWLSSFVVSLVFKFWIIQKSNLKNRWFLGPMIVFLCCVDGFPSKFKQRSWTCINFFLCGHSWIENKFLWQLILQMNLSRSRSFCTWCQDVHCWGRV